MVRLISDAAMNRVVSHLPGVHNELGDVARRVKRSAEGRLTVHRYSGAAKVTLSEGKVDWFVNLEDEAAMSIEFGHWAKTKGGEPIRGKDGKPIYVQGLYIISRAAGLF